MKVKDLILFSYTVVCFKLATFVRCLFTLSNRMDKFFVRLAEDLETYALHAKRKTIEVEDAELLLRRLWENLFKLALSLKHKYY